MPREQRQPGQRLPAAAVQWLCWQRTDAAASWPLVRVHPFYDLFEEGCCTSDTQACLHELVVQHGVWVAAGGLQKLVQALWTWKAASPDTSWGEHGKVASVKILELSRQHNSSGTAVQKIRWPQACLGAGAHAGSEGIQVLAISSTHLAWPIVGAVCAQHIQLLQLEIGLNGPQSLHLQARTLQVWLKAAVPGQDTGRKGTGQHNKWA